MKRTPLSNLLVACGAVVLVSMGTARAARNDILNTLDGGDLVSFTLNGVTGVETTRDGTVSLQTDNPFCVPTATVPCAYNANTIKLRLNNFTVNTNQGPYVFEGSYALITGPLPLTNSGADISVPIGTGVEVGAIISGPHVSRALRVSQSTTGANLRVRVSPELGFLAVDGTFPFDFDVSEIGQHFTGSISGLVSGQNPYVNTAPFVQINHDFTVICPQVVTLGPVVLADLESNVRSFYWSIAEAPTAQQLAPSVFLTEGVHVASLRVTDIYGGLGQASQTITVLNPPPTFTFVPGPVEALQCGAVAIGQAQATSPCGPVTITNDAPSFFSAGLHTVTWTAKSATGAVATATEKVVVWLNDDPACCPPGYNVIVGTSNNDHLVGTSGPDCILGRGGQDVIDGQGGDDIISGGDGDDQLSGGDGNDVISGGSGQDRIFGQAGNDVLGGQDGDDRLEGGDGDDMLFGGQGQDVLVCGAGDDAAYGGSGDDQLFGNDGNDLLDGGPDHNQCTGGVGFDTIVNCTALDTPESNGPIGFPGDPTYNACTCHPSKCNDCSSSVAACNSTSGCPQILECVQQTAGCNLPHECSSPCETGRTSAAIQTARTLASCFGGCIK